MVADITVDDYLIPGAGIGGGYIDAFRYLSDARCIDKKFVGAVSGFEPLDILLAVDSLVAQIESGQPRIEIAYRRGVRPEGNIPALKLMETVFEVSGANWRGIGVIPSSGLQLRPEYEKYDAGKRFTIDPGPTREPRGCICGSILRGVSTPLDCKLFRGTCSPENPVGPCMVSAEGSCATYYHYGDNYGR